MFRNLLSLLILLSAVTLGILIGFYYPDWIAEKRFQSEFRAVAPAPQWFDSLEPVSIDPQLPRHEKYQIVLQCCSDETELQRQRFRFEYQLISEHGYEDPDTALIAAVGILESPLEYPHQTGLAALLLDRFLHHQSSREGCFGCSNARDVVRLAKHYANLLVHEGNIAGAETIIDQVIEARRWDMDIQEYTDLREIEIWAHERSGNLQAAYRSATKLSERIEADTRHMCPNDAIPYRALRERKQRLDANIRRIKNELGIAPPADKVAVNLKLHFAGEPLQLKTQPTISCKSWALRKSVGCFREYLVEESRLILHLPGDDLYRFIIEVDENTDNDPTFPGDFVAQPEIKVGSESQQHFAVDMKKIIHMTAPADNNELIAGFLGDCDEKPTYPVALEKDGTQVSNIEFAWQPVVDGAQYVYRLFRMQCSPFKTIERIQESRTYQTQTKLNLPVSHTDEFYLLRLEATKNGRDVGDFYLSGIEAGQTWNYRFRVVD